jgi:hypothetical protein
LLKSRGDGFNVRQGGTVTTSLTETDDEHSEAHIRRQVRGADMSERSRENQESAEAPNDGSAVEQENYGSLSVEDDPAGTEDPADLAGTANPDDAKEASRPSVSEADER